jgi:3-hydroxyisobutyrate dehydrogenase
MMASTKLNGLGACSSFSNREAEMASVAILGLGAMGSRMAMRLIKHGHQVTVWNRTPAAAEPLVAAGASFASTPKEAANQASIIISMVRDDAASASVWLDPKDGAVNGMQEGAIAIESSTVSHDWISQLGAAISASGFSLLDAPVSGSRPQADAGELAFLVGGEAEILQCARPTLMSLGTSVDHVGPLGSGVLVKLATNALLGVQVAAIGELFGLLNAHGVDLNMAFDAIGSTSVASVAMQRSAASMLAANFAPQFPVELITKDFGYAIKAAGSAAAVPTIAAAGHVFDTAMFKGFGEKNMTSVVELFLPRG